MRISVVTVCKNAGMLLEKTILSVLMQKGNNFEYIIQDGESCDNTLSIAQIYEEKFRKRNIQYKIESETDHGVADGMNNAIDKCQGEWVIFLNAGDTFYNNSVLEYFEKIGAQSEADIVFGHTNYIFPRNKKLIVTRKAKDVFRGMGICQQSTFYKREILEHRKFDARYLLADYEYLLYMYTQNYKFLSINMIVSNYGYDGATSTKGSLVRKERKQIMNHYKIRYNHRPYIYVKIKEKLLNKFPILKTMLVVHTELNKKG